ncbi:MAG TPA: DNA polymerase IV [Candidatus Didemnitutus sp.]|nr:DNA polymerase IV [Candidatus Didemnitutus sp.]
MILPTIVHLDADAFFVSVEQALHPELRGKKVAVGGRQRGIISSASYEARACGVYTPMPSRTALRVCPDLILVGHTAGAYSQYTRRMFDLCETLTPIVQRNSIDEGYLDLAACGLKSVAAIEEKVRGLQQRITRELGITASFGIAANKLVAAIASKARKPRGFTIVLPGTETEFLAPLSIGVLPGIGRKTEATLVESGLKKVSDLFRFSERELESRFGRGWMDVIAMARGEDNRRVEPDREDAKSYSTQETFGQDIAGFAAIETIAKRMVDELMPAIRADGKRVRTMTIKVRYPGMEDSSSGRSLAEASDLEAVFYPLIAPLLRAAWTRRRPLRLISVRFSGVDEQPAQLEMFGQEDERRRRLASVLDKINAGKAPAVRRGHQLEGERSM